MENVNILIVEDSLTQAIKIQASLDIYNYKTRLANNGLEALEKIAEEKPTLILTDVVMPEMDGFELCREIKSNPETKNIPIIILTALSDLQDVVNGLDCGADNFLIKPCSDKALLKRIDYILTNMEIRHNSPIDMGIDIFFNGKQHNITSQRMQILDLLFSAFDNVYQQQLELRKCEENAQIASNRIELLEKEKSEIAAGTERTEEEMIHYTGS